jgi:hypothetical protein
LISERVKLTMDFECLAGAGLDPFTIDITNILLEK